MNRLLREVIRYEPSYFLMPKNKRSNSASRAAKRARTPDSNVATSVAKESGDARAQHSAPPAHLVNWRPIYALIPPLLALLTSINSLRNGFAFDDEQQLLRNEFIKSLANLPDAFTTSVWSFMGDTASLDPDAYYRPLFTTLFTINHAIFGTTAWGWHLVNVLVHAGVTLLVWLVLKEVTNREGVSAIASALFAVHPVHAESVAWISGITDPWLALFVLPAFYFYLRYRKDRRKRLMAAALGFYFLALLSKETAIGLPVVVAYCELVHFKDSRSRRQRAIALTTMGALFVAPTLIYLLLRYHAIESFFLRTNPRFTWGEALLTTPLASMKYLTMLAVPAGYSLHHYTLPVESLSLAAFYGPLALLAAAGVAILIGRSRALMFAAVWFVVWMALPLAGLRVFDPQYSIQERYLYLPSIGFCLAVALGIEWLAERRLAVLSGRVAAAMLLIAMVIALGAVHLNQNLVWRNTVTLFQHIVATDPRSPLAHNELASVYYGEGRRQEAEAETRTALELDPNFVDAYISLGMFAFNNGKSDQSIKYLEQAKALVGERRLKQRYLGRIHSDLGFYYEQRKEFDRAEQNYRLAADNLPCANTFIALGRFYLDRRRYEEARDLFERSLPQVSRRYAPIHLQLAKTYDSLGQRDLARSEYQIYIELAPYAPDSANARRRLAQLESAN